MKKKTLAFTTAALLATAGLTQAQITVESVTSFVDNNADNTEGVGVFNASLYDKLVVIITGEHGFPNNTNGINISGVTYDGVSMFEAITRDGLPEVNDVSPDQLFNHMYYLDAPFGQTGTIQVDSNLSRFVVTAIGLDGTANGLGNTAISGLASKSVELTTTSANSFIIASNGVGGTGNNGNVDGLFANSPLSLLSAVETSSNYAGHLIGGTTVENPSNNTYSFTGGTNGSHVIAAEFLLGAPPPVLKLQVNTVTGQVTMIGDSTDAISMSYYEITSAAGSLNTSGWNSFADQDYDGNGPANGSGNGWEEAGGSNASALAEAYLLGNSEIAADTQINLGLAYDTSVDAQDLAFRFLTNQGKIRFGEIEYLSLLIGDMNNDTLINNLDINPFVLALTDPQAYQNAFGIDPNLVGDVSGDGVLNNLDINPFVALLTGQGVASAEADVAMAFAAVPEPSSLALLFGGIFLANRRSRK